MLHVTVGNLFLACFFAKHVYSSEQFQDSSQCTIRESWSDNNCLIGPVAVHTNISPNVFHQLCPSGDGRYPGPSSCDFYIICHGDHLTVNKCPTETHFHPIDKQCVDAHLFECSYPPVADAKSFLKATTKFKRQVDYAAIDRRASSNLRKFCRGYEGIYPHPLRCDYFLQCGAGGDVYERRCALGTAFNPRLSICDHERNVGCSSRNKRFVDQGIIESKSLKSHVVTKRSTCDKNYVQPDPQFCKRFQICSNGRIHVQECGPGTLFDPLRKVCAARNEVDCGSRLRDFGTFDCQLGHKYITSHPDDCKKFLECEHEQIHVKTCPGKLIFNPEIGICDHSYRTECRKPISLAHDTDINFHATRRLVRANDELAKYACEFDYIAPLDGSCTQFIECEKKRLFKKSCGPGTAYNPIIGACDWPRNVRTGDPTHCKRYQQCDGKRFVPATCEGNNYYNAVTGKCDTIERVNCEGKADNPRRPGIPYQS